MLPPICERTKVLGPQCRVCRSSAIPRDTRAHHPPARRRFRLAPLPNAGFRSADRLRPGHHASAVLAVHHTSPARRARHPRTPRQMDHMVLRHCRRLHVRPSAHRIHLAPAHGPLRADATAMESHRRPCWRSGSRRRRVPRIHDVQLQIGPLLQSRQLVPHLRSEPHGARSAQNLRHRQYRRRARLVHGRNRADRVCRHRRSHHPPAMVRRQSRRFRYCARRFCD